MNENGMKAKHGGMLNFGNSSSNPSQTLYVKIVFCLSYAFRNLLWNVKRHLRDLNW